MISAESGFHSFDFHLQTFARARRDVVRGHRRVIVVVIVLVVAAAVEDVQVVGAVAET